MNMSKLSGFLELLKAPLKILSQNGKLMAITATVYLILYSISFILYMLSANPFILDLTHKLIALASARPGTPDFSKLLVAIREDTGIFLGIEVAYFVLFFFVALFAQTAVVITASCYYSGHDLSLKELFLKVSKTWTRPFVTSLWIQLLSLGYTSFFLLPFLVPSLVLFDHPFVVSVVEDSYGYSALGKAKVLVNGKRVHGFLLNFFLNLVTLVIIVTGSKLMKLSPAMPIVVGVIQVLLIGIISMFKSIAYCEFYVQCKNNMTKLGGFGL
ncbi:hypothetical protein HanRHA438_Chr03g0105991 [Helianthus annuus]|nr:hypothetical protein HanRHA438_Chr03g0105991 [Helianthus annuus]